jgi:hypothetical protein
MTECYYARAAHESSASVAWYLGTGVKPIRDVLAAYATLHRRMEALGHGESFHWDVVLQYSAYCNIVPLVTCDKIVCGVLHFGSFWAQSMDVCEAHSGVILWA